MKTKIEKFYRARVDYDCDDWGKPVDRILAFGRSLEHCEVFEGNGACYPYAYGESHSEAQLRDWVGKVERYITKLKGGKINP